MEKHLSMPITEKEIRSLDIGDIVYLSGELVQLLAPAHRRAIAMKKKGDDLPFDVENMGIYHCYSCLDKEDGHLHCHFLGASTSAGVNTYEADFIRMFGIRIIVGKGGMDQNTLDAMKDTGCVYMAQIGGCCQLCTQAVVETREAFWEDLAANIGVKHVFKDLGPLIVSMDAKGNSLFDQVNRQVLENKKTVYKKIEKGRE